MQTLSYKNTFDLHENETVGGPHFHMNGFALGLVLTQATRKWSIEKIGCDIMREKTSPFHSKERSLVREG